MAGTMVLGPVVFRDFEVPGRVSWGGAQRLSVHELPGGRRVIDAMGRGDAPIAWEGVFSGADAALRARLLDLMRGDGGVWPLTWGGFFYSVVIQHFAVQYERAEWMPYRIVCAVLRDEVEAVVEDAVALLRAVGADLLAVDQAGLGVDVTGAQAALAAPGAGVLGGAGYAPAQAGVSGVRAAVEAGVAAGGAAATAASAALGGAALGGAGAASGFAALAAAGAAAGDLARGGMALGFARRADAMLNQAGS